MHATTYEDIRFYEGRPHRYEELGRVETEIGGYIFSHAQLKSLNDVKSVLAAKAKQMGGNAILDFRYGQRSVSWWRSLLQLDDVNWYGEGTVAIV